MLWARIKAALSKQTDREFSVKVEEARKAVKKAQASDAALLKQIVLLEQALKHDHR